MSATVALIACLVLAMVLMGIDSRRRSGYSLSIWIPVTWAVLISSRPVASWLSFGGAGGLSEAYDAGSPFDRLVYFGLIVVALGVLAARHMKIGHLLRSNRWLLVFMLYAAVSVLWSDAPMVGFKRWIKDVGNVLMVLILLSEQRPAEAIKATLFRVAAVLIPLSVLFIKFLPTLGRTYHVWSGEMMFTGVATHKNGLGALAMLCWVFLVWDVVERVASKQYKTSLLGFAGDLALLFMTAWLLKMSGSATALLCAGLGSSVLVGLRLEMVQRNIRALTILLLVGGPLLWLLDSTLGFSQFIVVDLLGRDLTLTTRTDVWPVLLGYADNVMLGAGFNSFWSGDRLQDIYSQFGIIQAHNGYLETYLNGGLIAVSLLGLLLMSTARKIYKGLLSGGELAGISAAVFVIALTYNVSEAAFSKMSLVWFTFLLCTVSYTVASQPEVATGNGGKRRQQRLLPGARGSLVPGKPGR